MGIAERAVYAQTSAGGIVFFSEKVKTHKECGVVRAR